MDRISKEEFFKLYEECKRTELQLAQLQLRLEGIKRIFKKDCYHTYPDGETAYEGGYFETRCNICGWNDGGY